MTCSPMSAFSLWLLHHVQLVQIKFGCFKLEVEMISSGLGLPCAPTLYCRRLATNRSSGISESSITTWDGVPLPGWTSGAGQNQLVELICLGVCCCGSSACFVLHDVACVVVVACVLLASAYTEMLWQLYTPGLTSQHAISGHQGQLLTRQQTRASSMIM